MAMLDPNNRYQLVASVTATITNVDTWEARRAEVRDEGDAISFLVANPEYTRLGLQDEAGRVFRIWDRDGDTLRVAYEDHTQAPAWFG
ncbi:MAG: hypothetical protein WBA46_01780 [Thermomicrobiales bacterium]